MLHDTALEEVAVDLQLRNQTIESVPGERVPDRDETVYEADRGRNTLAADP
jgi:hypothetical protein